MSLSFDAKLDNYADLAVRRGVNVQPGQRLLVRAPVDCAPLARLIVDKAYRAGAKLVDVLWADDAVALSRFANGPEETFDEISTWAGDALIKGAERGDAVLTVYAADPDLLKDQDPGKVAKVQKNMQIHMQPFSRRIINKEINWCIVGASIPAWAEKVFPDLKGEAAVSRLWDELFRICRADLDDPLGAWETHTASLRARRDHLGAKQYDALHYRGPGTDLKVGLPANHVWLGGTSHAGNGVPFIANMPTEEVFSLPHKDRVDGTVRATKPLSYAGALIDGFSLEFAAGKVVGLKAEKNEAVLKNLVATDEGAARLGEVALVPQKSPIAESGILFYNTLYDENASCHLAVGKAYRVCIEGGEKLSDEDFAAAGGNDSLTHVDFMIGSPELDVDGILKDGSVEPLMRGGEWAYEG